jgi:hypothetical protein
MRLVPFVSAAALVLAGSATPLFAQNAQCTPYSSAQQAENVCNAAIDGTHAFHPILGLLTSGGNPVLGAASTLGGLGHFYLNARVNATEVVLPDLSYNGSSTVVGAGTKIFFPSPLVEGAVGLFGGTSAGLGAVDLLGSAQLLPTTQIDNFSVDSGARRIGSVALGLGIGARIGLLREAGPLPGVSVSVMRRNVPQLQYGNLTTGSDYTYAADLNATNLRLTASKHLALLNVGAGIGWDQYTGSSRIQFRNPITSLAEAPIDLELKNSRTMGYLNAGLDLHNFKLMAEGGYQLGKDQNLSTTFTDFNPSAGRFFAGAGLTVGL